MQTTCSQNHSLSSSRKSAESHGETFPSSVAELRVRICDEVKLFHRSVVPAAGCSIGPTSLVAVVSRLNDAVGRANAHDALYEAEMSTADENRQGQLEEISEANCVERSDLEDQIKLAPIRSIGDLVVLAKLAEHQHFYGQMDDDMPVLLADTILRMFSGRGFRDQADGKCADRPIDLDGRDAGQHRNEPVPRLSPTSPDLDEVSDAVEQLHVDDDLEEDETELLRRRTRINHLSLIDSSKLSAGMAKLWSELCERDRMDEDMYSEEEHAEEHERLYRIWEALRDGNLRRHREIIREIVASSPQTIGDLALKCLIVWHEYQNGTPNYACAAMAAERALSYAGMLPAPVVYQRGGNSPNNFALLYEEGMAS
ncbi:hypothetical protein [Hyphomicrobium sp. CS1BSMeth3]|uniref:hypothetical protein n=1 Tax=Hyphomicrobium sp. CS1BSMeth3 TaxID=1892844 RepID=UPI0011609D36|nr:hypothetical protein [Hyphomicrobium sp. CS1BSMeth3]